MEQNGDKIERVGKVVLDLSDYTGDDLYSEGSTEDELLEAVRSHEAKEYNRLIADVRKWGFLYHLSDFRGNIVDFLPIEKTDTVLEVGAGCGAVTGTLAEKAGRVICIDLSHKRSLINAERNRERDNVEIRVGNFQDVEKGLEEKYDYITLIGAFEYAGSYIEAPDPYGEFLRILAKHLKDGGSLVIAIENKYGLKYFAGCREDHTGKFYDGIEGYPDQHAVRTFSAKGLRRLAEAASLTPCFYYPYPDYKLPVTVYSDERLPSLGELNDNVCNFDTDRFVAFHEGAAFDELIREGSFPDFSNSFLVVLKKDDHRKGGFDQRRTVYSKHSIERDARFQVRTDLEISEQGERVIVKHPFSRAALPHLENMARAGAKLASLFSGTKFLVNRVKRINDGEGALRRLEFEFLEGPTLMDELLTCQAENRTDDALMVLKSFCDTLRALRDLIPFERTPRFTEIFGEITVPERSYCMPVTNADLIFSNLISNGGWNMIDYEWTFDFPIPLDFVIYRAVFYLVQELPEGCFDGVDLFGAAGLTAGECEIYRLMEHSFQCYIKGGRFTLPELYSIMGRDSFTLGAASRQASLLFRPAHVKLYYDRGSGFSEWDSYGMDAGRDDDGTIRLKVLLPEDVKALRLDPVESRCMVKVRRLAAGGRALEAEANGEVCGKNTVLFDTEDPQILIPEVEPGTLFEAEYKICMIDRELFSDLAGRLAEAQKEPERIRLFADRRRETKSEWRRIQPG